MRSRIKSPETAHETERVLIKEVVARWRGRWLSEIGKSDVHAMLDEVVDRAPILANRLPGSLSENVRLGGRARHD